MASPSNTSSSRPPRNNGGERSNRHRYSNYLPQLVKINNNLPKEKGFSATSLITLGALFVTIVFNILTYTATKADLGLKAAEKESAYSEYVANIETQSEQISFDRKYTNDTLYIDNQTGHKVHLSFVYNTLNNHWVAVGPYTLDQNDTLDIGRSRNKVIYVHIDRIARDTLPKYFNDQGLASSDSVPVVIRKEVQHYAVDIGKDPPYKDTISKFFHQVILTGKQKVYLTDTLIDPLRFKK